MEEAVFTGPRAVVGQPLRAEGIDILPHVEMLPSAELGSSAEDIYL